ncbi:hypothetical protein KY335_00350 [Candidatus Woesearchaeota archaeon]|nr:hypothetical protein [Candidatus Woesearchaeota archaeon]
MADIFFPNQYKKALLNKTKNTTIRVGKEVGKYKAGKTYSAKSYAGREWGIKIKILNISKTTVDKLSDFGLQKRNIERVKKEKGITSNTKVEVIKFKVLD